MRRARAVKLGIILDRLGQHRGIAVTRDLRAGSLKRGEDRRDGAVGIDGDILALEIGERRLERGAVMDAHTVAEKRAHRVGELFGRDEKIGGRGGVEKRSEEHTYELQSIMRQPYRVLG